MIFIIQKQRLEIIRYSIHQIPRPVFRPKFGSRPQNGTKRHTYRLSNQPATFVEARGLGATRGALAHWRSAKLAATGMLRLLIWWVTCFLGMLELEIHSTWSFCVCFKNAKLHKVVNASMQSERIRKTVSYVFLHLHCVKNGLCCWSSWQIVTLSRI